MRPSLVLALAGALTLAGFGACASSLPVAPAIPQPQEAFSDVPYPPPAGKVEYVPARPTPDALWIDGQWRWVDGRWTWEHGGWYQVPLGVGFSKWQAARDDASGTLRFASGTWRDAKGNEVSAPKLLASATAGPNVGVEAGPPEEDASSEASLGDAPSLFDGALYDAAVLHEPIVREGGLEDGPEDAHEPRGGER